MAYIKNTWVDQQVERPKTYEMVNNSDGSVTLVDSFGLVSELGTPVNADNMNHIEDGIENHDRRLDILEGEGARADVNLSNLTEQGEKHFLNKQQITNCILEVPQRIKLELNNGVLTLRAGSEAYELDGNFTSVTTDQDYTVNSAIVSGTLVVFANVQSKTMWCPPVTSVSSGSSFPTVATEGQWLYHLNTTDNLLYQTLGTTSWSLIPQATLPVGIITHYNGAITIDQVFNGFGFVGNTIWIDKGVKYLVAKGRNDDGSLKNYEVEIPELRLTTFTNTLNKYAILNFAGSVIGGTADFITSVKQPTVSNTSLWYNPGTNITSIVLADGTVNTPYYEMACGTLEYLSTGRIKSFTPYQPFRAMDYNDKQEIISWGMPDYTAGIAIGGGSNYMAPTNGFVSYAPINNTSTANIVSQGMQGYIAINGYTVLTSAHQQNHDTAHPSSGFFLVGKGETIFHTMTAGTVYFYPCKGVS